jgi:hypothetical protein
MENMTRKYRKVSVFFVLLFLIGFFSVLSINPLTVKADSGTFYVDDGNDDAYESGSGIFVITGEHVFCESNTDTGSFSYRCLGLRFPSVNIPQGSTISSATINVYVRDTDDDDANLKIYGNDVNDANDFNDEQDIIDTRTRTTSYHSWVEDGLLTGWESESGLESVIQEITDRGGWSSGNALVLLFIANTDNSLKDLEIKTFEEATGKEAYLEITWTSANNPPNYPSLNYPSNNSLGHPLTVTLNVTYSDSDGDAGTVWFYNNISGAYLGVDTSVSNNTYANYTWSGLSWGTKYQWHVIANDGTDNSTIDAFFVFYTNYRPQYSLNYPSNNSANIPLSPTLNVTYYDVEGSTGTVWFYNNKTGSYLGNDTSVSNNTYATFTWSNLYHSTNYFWHVIANDGSLNSSLTVFFNFTTLTLYVNVTYYLTPYGDFWVNNVTVSNGTENQYVQGSTVELTCLPDSDFGFRNFTYRNATTVFDTYTDNPQKTVNLNYNGSIWLYMSNITEVTNQYFTMFDFNEIFFGTYAFLGIMLIIGVNLFLIYKDRRIGGILMVIPLLLLETMYFDRIPTTPFLVWYMIICLCLVIFNLAMVITPRGDD